MRRIRSTCRRASPRPGVEAKELFRPLNQLSLQAQVTDTVSVAAQLMLEWESFRYPEGGTYYGPVDFAFNGPDRQFISPALGFAARGGAVEPDQAGRVGRGDALEPGVARRHPRLLLPQLRRQAAADLHHPGGPEQQPLQPDLRRRRRPLRHQPGEEHRRRQRRRRSLLPPQHAAVEPGARRLARHAVGGQHQRTARRHRARAGQWRRHDPEDAGVRQRQLGGGARPGRTGPR